MRDNRWMFLGGAIFLAGWMTTVVPGQGRHQEDPRLKEYEKPGVRFDVLVRDDFFAGMAGDVARLNRGMQFCEKVLIKHPHHAEALVWHGGGLLTRSSIAYSRGDFRSG